MMKELETWLIIDYLKGTFRTVTAKRKLTKVKPTEIPVKLTFKIDVPDKQSFKAEFKITLTPEKMSEIALEQLKE